MKKRLAILALFILPGAAIETAPQSSYDAGVAARHAGRTDEAIELLGRAVAAEPDNADAHIQLGLALMAAGRLDEAERALKRTLELAPDYEDARLALARLEQRRVDAAVPPGPAERVHPGATEPTALRSGLGPAEARERGAYRTEVNLDASYSPLDRGARDWREASLGVRHRIAQGTAVTATLEASRRFGLDDLYGELRIDRRFSSGASAYVSAGATPDADFRPRWQVGAGGAVRVRSGPAATVVTLDARQARYATGDIQTLSPGVEQYLAGGRAWLTGRLINIFDEQGRHRLGWLARGDVQATPRLRLFAGLADAPDTSAGVVVDTFSLFGGLSLDVGRRTTFRLSAAREDRAFGADRLQVALGLGFRF